MITRIVVVVQLGLLVVGLAVVGVVVGVVVVVDLAVVGLAVVGLAVVGLAVVVVVLVGLAVLGHIVRFSACDRLARADEREVWLRSKLGNQTIDRPQCGAGIRVVEEGAELLATHPGRPGER